MERTQEVKKQRFAFYVERMRGLSPLAKLNQGFSYVSAEDGKVIKAVADVQQGDDIKIYVTDGVIRASVKDAYREEYSGSRE